MKSLKKIIDLASVKLLLTIKYIKMKKTLLLLAIISIAFVSCKEDATKKIKQDNLEKAKKANLQRGADKENAPVIEFEKTEHDFGNLKEGDKVETVFKFKNTGKSELLITKIKGSCGCTVPSDWSREPIMPGQESSFTVKFNTTNKPNKQSKTITLTCNTVKGREVVKIKAQVEPDAELAKKRAERAAKRKKQNEEKAAKRAAEAAKSKDTKGEFTIKK